MYILYTVFKLNSQSRIWIKLKYIKNRNFLRDYGVKNVVKSKKIKNNLRKKVNILKKFY